MSKRIIIGLIILVFYPNLDTAQESLKILSLSQALEIGQRNNINLQQGQQRIQQSMAKMQAQKSSYFPKVAASGLYNHITDIPDINLPVFPTTTTANDVDLYDLSLKLQQPLFTGFRIHHLLRSTEEELNYSQAQYLTDMNEIAYQIIAVYRSAQLNLLQQKVLQSSFRRIKNDLESTLHFYRAGQTSAFDTLTMANQYLKIQTELNELNHHYQILLNQLEFLLNISPIHGVEEFSSTEIMPDLQPLEHYLQFAVQHRSELKQIKHRYQAQRYVKKSLTSSYWPQMYGQITFHYLKPDVDILRTEWTDFFILGVNLQWDLWDSGRRKQEIRQLTHALNILSLEEQKVIAKVQNDVKQAYENLLTDRDQFLLSKKLVQQEQERYRIAHQKYEQGLASAVDLSNAEISLTAAELHQEQTVIKWWLDRSFMDYTIGKFITAEK